METWAAFVLWKHCWWILLINQDIENNFGYNQIWLQMRVIVYEITLTSYHAACGIMLCQSVLYV